MPSVLILLEGKDKQPWLQYVDEAPGIQHRETPFLSQHLQP